MTKRRIAFQYSSLGLTVLTFLLAVSAFPFLQTPTIAEALAPTIRVAKPRSYHGYASRLYTIPPKQASHQPIQDVLEETTNTTRTPPLQKRDSEHSALHHVEERAKEKGALAVSQKATEHVVSAMERTAAEHVYKRTVTELAAGERLSEWFRLTFLGERSAERASERTLKALGERSLEHVASEGIERAAEHIGEEAAERMVERLGQRASTRTGKRMLASGAERAAERLGENSAERAAERIVANRAERVAERVGEKLGERSLERVTANSALHTAERMGERSTERALERVGERSTERALERVTERSLERVAARIGRGLLIALPALGGVFAFHLFRADLQRVQKERKERSLSFLFFAGAGLADAVDTVLHFWIFFALLAQFAHHELVVAEKWSMACAIVSTSCAVLGEIVAHRMRYKRA